MAGIAIPLITGLIPILPSIIKMVEQAFAGKPGPVKLEAATNLATVTLDGLASATGSTAIAPTREAIQAAIEVILQQQKGGIAAPATPVLPIVLHGTVIVIPEAK